MLFFDVHTHFKFSIVNKYPDAVDFSMPFSIGIHPWFINIETLSQELLVVEEKLQETNCYAIGECGLDTVCQIDLDLQKEVFKKHIQLSEKYKRPIIIHCVKALDEIIAFRKELKPKQVWILHGFQSSFQVADSLFKNDIFIAIGAAILQNKKLQETVYKMPLSAILLETDNKEISIIEIYKKVAVLKGVPVEILQQEIKHNFNSIFKR